MLFPLAAAANIENGTDWYKNSEAYSKSRSEQFQTWCKNVKAYAKNGEYWNAQFEGLSRLS